MNPALDSVKRLYADLLDAWNRRDAEAFARGFVADGALIGFDGSTANGRSDIEDHLNLIFADHPTAVFVTIVRDVRSVGQQVAILRATAGMVPPGKDRVMPERNCLQTLVASRDGEAWRIELFQNTPAALHGRPKEVEELTRELQEKFDRAGEVQPA